MNHQDKSVELKEYYRSTSTVHLAEIYINGGLTEDALSILEDEFSNRGIDPADLNNEYLNKLLVESGRPEGIGRLSYQHPISHSLQRIAAFIFDRDGHFKQFATEHPIAFSLIIVPTLPWLLCFLFAGIDLLVGESFRGITYYFKPAEISAFVIWIFILWRFGWFRNAGFISIGKGSTWLLMLMIFAIDYIIMVYFHPGEYQGDYLIGLEDFSEFNVIIIHALPFYLLFALIEETGFRGLMLYCLLRVYGNNRSGIIKAVLISSLIFGLMHIPYNSFGDNNWIVMLLAPLSPFIGGIFFCALLLHAKCIWIPVLYHALSNTLSSYVTGVWWDSTDEATWFIVNLIMVHFLMLILAIYLLFRLDRDDSISCT